MVHFYAASLGLALQASGDAPRDLGIRWPSGRQSRRGYAAEAVRPHPPARTSPPLAGPRDRPSGTAPPRPAPRPREWSVPPPPRPPPPPPPPHPPAYPPPPLTPP